jgi:predicted nucleic acid-binding protein
VADVRVFLDANVLFTAAYSPEGLSALLIELGATGHVELVTSTLAVVEAQRNLGVKRPDALPAFEQNLAAIEIVREPAPTDVEKLTPSTLSAKDRPLLAAAILSRATHFVTGDQTHFGRWMRERTALPLKIMTPRQLLDEGPS